MNLNPIAAADERMQSAAGESAQTSAAGVSPESVLVDRILAGDTQAFAAIVQRWQGPLINLAWRYCRDRGRAEEMAQEALIRVWRGLRQWRREGSFSTWMFSVAANVYRTELKRIPSAVFSNFSNQPGNQALDEALTTGNELSTASGYDAGPEAYLDNAVRDEAVRRAVLALPDKYREPLILFYFHEMDVAAAAGSMGIPEGTLKARLSRGRDLLRRRFPQLREQLPGESGERRRVNPPDSSAHGPPAKEDTLRIESRKSSPGKESSHEQPDR